MKRKGFTMIEVLIVVVIISLGVVSLLTGIRSSSSYIQKMRAKIIAINLAREGVEQTYQIRNTNRQKRAGKKDQCRLKTNPLIDEGTIGCEDDPRITSGSYISMMTGDDQKYFVLIKQTEGLNTEDGIQTGDKQFSLCQNGSQWTTCPGQDSESNQGYFFREIKVFGLFDKSPTTTGGNEISCSNGSTNGSPDCGGRSAKELRFCSRIEYLGQHEGNVELCSIITNFKE